MEIGICKYCLEEKPLAGSHLIPAALYRRLGEQRIVSSPEEVKYDTFQLKGFVLCEKCDHSLSDDGESWTIPLLAQKDGSFPLYDLLRKVQPDRVEAAEEIYAAARNPEIDVQKLTHFAVAIFWKASVHSWQKTKIKGMIGLGPYGEEIRKFLRADGPFPKNLVLRVAVLPPPVKQMSFFPPFLNEKSAFRTYSLYVLGIWFALSVGKQAGRLRENCFCSHPTHPITVFDFSDELERAHQRYTSEAKISSRVKKRGVNVQ